MAAAAGDPQSSNKLPKPALLIVVGEPHTDEQKDLILQRIVKGRHSLFFVVFLLPLITYTFS
jgi:hypothetical protein